MKVTDNKVTTCKEGHRDKIEGTEENWENRALGADEDFVQESTLTEEEAKGL